MACTNKKIGSKIGAWEQGLLGEEERVEFEAHLLECQSCFGEAASFSEAAELIRDPVVRTELVKRLEATPGKDLWWWVRIPFAQPALVAVAAVVVVAVIGLAIWQFWPGAETPVGRDLVALLAPTAEARTVDISRMRSHSVAASSDTARSLRGLQFQPEYSSEINIKLVVNKRGDPPRYRVGDRIKIGLRPDSDCYVYILDLQPDGRMSLLYPGGGYRDNFARAGEPFLIPPERGVTMLVTEPTGIERLFAAALRERINLANFSDEELIDFLIDHIVAEAEFFIEE